MDRDGEPFSVAQHKGQAEEDLWISTHICDLLSDAEVKGFPISVACWFYCCPNRRLCWIQSLLLEKQSQTGSACPTLLLCLPGPVFVQQQIFVHDWTVEGRKLLTGAAVETLSVALSGWFANAIILLGSLLSLIYEDIAVKSNAFKTLYRIFIISYNLKNGKDRWFSEVFFLFFKYNLQQIRPHRFANLCKRRIKSPD